MGAFSFYRYCNGKRITPHNKSCNGFVPVRFGGDEEDRTLDLTDANRTLSQLSYAPIYGAVINAANYYTPTGVHLSIGFYRIFANFV